MTNEEVYGAALEVIKEHGWVSGMSGDDDRGYCLLGAIQHVTGSKHTYAGERMEKAVQGLGFDDITDAWRFNDRKGRAAVIELLASRSRYGRLHRALDESRVAHAQRDLGRRVPDTVPAAWEQEQGRVPVTA